MDGYREADEVEEEVRNVGVGTDLFTYYSVGLPILLRIFAYLDVPTLSRVVLVNRAWYTHNKDRLTDSHDVEKSLHICDYLSYLVQNQIKEIKLKDQAYIAAKKNKQRNAALFTADPLVEYNPTDNTIDYVNATVDLLRQYLKLQAARQLQKKRMGLNDKEEQDRRAFLNQLLKIMNTQLRDTTLALSDILSGRTKWNSNFEIFELSLRRYYEQLKVLFPANPSSGASPSRKRASPTAIISDPQARLVWQMRVGSDKYSCDFERFYEVVIEREFLAVTSEKMKQDLYYYFNYFLNFPRDNMVTTYKWEVLTRLFGPYHEFIENFSKYVLGSGFLGLINRHHAEEILENHPECVLMRFSRTYPTCLAFSFRKKDGKYDHYTNNPVWHGYPPFKGTRPKEETKNNIPIKEFLEKVFLRKGYQLLPLRVDGKSVATKGTASKYAQVADPYLDTDRFDGADQPSADEVSAPRWGAYKNYAASSSSSSTSSPFFSDQSGSYVADAQTSPTESRRSWPQQPENYVADSISGFGPTTGRGPATSQPDNYVADSISDAPSILYPASPISPSPSLAPSRGGARGYQPSSPSRASPYSDVFEYQRQAARERGRGASSESVGGSGTAPAVAQTTKSRETPGSKPSRDENVCFYMDGQSVKEELERNLAPSGGSSSAAAAASTKKNKRAESFQANYLDDVVFVQEEEEEAALHRSNRIAAPSGRAADQTAVFREYAAGQRETSHQTRRGQTTVIATATATLSGAGLYIGGGEETATAVTTDGVSQQDNLILAALLGGSAAADEKNKESAKGTLEGKGEDVEKREKERRRRERRERTKKEFEMNAYMYERDGDIHFVDEDQCFSDSANANDSYATPAGVVDNNRAPVPTKKAEELDEDSILAAILGQQQQQQGTSSSHSNYRPAAREAAKEEEETEEERRRREKEERRREKEERRKRKEERRRKKEEQRKKAAEEFEEAATAYGASVGASLGSAYLAEDDLLPRSRDEAVQKSAQWDEYFLEEQKPGVERSEERRKADWEESEDEEIMAALLGGDSAKKQQQRRADGRPEEARDAYAVPFAESAEEEEEEEGDDSECEKEVEVDREEEDALARKKTEEKERRDREEELARLEEQTVAEARQKEGFVLPYNELVTTLKELLPRYVDRSKLESYLSDEEFQMVFGCTRNVFYTHKVWRQRQLKKNAGLF